MGHCHLQSQHIVPIFHSSLGIFPFDKKRKLKFPFISLSLFKVPNFFFKKTKHFLSNQIGSQDLFLCPKKKKLVPKRHEFSLCQTSTNGLSPVATCYNKNIVSHYVVFFFGVLSFLLATWHQHRGRTFKAKIKMSATRGAISSNIVPY